MVSTGVDASIPEAEAWTLRVSSKHSRKYLERCLRQGPTGSVWVLKGWAETFLCSLAETVSLFLSGRGHHFPAPTWEGCRATPKTLLSRSALPAGGCRSSGWALVLLAVVLRALFFLLACGFGVSFSWSLTRRPAFFRRCPLDVLGLWFPATEASRVGGTQSRLRRDGSGPESHHPPRLVTVHVLRARAAEALRLTRE